jgi:hypothetical protein
MRQNTPTAGLEIILDFHSLDLVVKGEGLKAFGRLVNVNHLRTVWDGLGRLCKGHRRFWADLAVSNDISLLKEDVCPLAFNWVPPFHYLSSRDNTPSVRFFVAATCSEHEAAVSIVVVKTVNQSRIGRVHAVSGQKLLGSSTTSAIVASITSCCRGLWPDDLASGVDFCMKSIPVSLGKPFIVVKTILDCITAIREVGSVSLSQPCNLWEKVMEQKALKAG